MKVRTRFAPSPTGFMHVGNLRTALYEYLIAKSNKGKFILRIEDTDQDRYVEGSIDLIYKTIKTVGLTYDEGPDVGGDFGPYIQSERKDIYMPYAKQLIDKGEAYYCFCSKERLEKINEGKIGAGYDNCCRNLPKEEVEKLLKENKPYVVRQKMPTEGETTFIDSVFGEITIENSEIEDHILIKSDGFPTYNFANVIDDHEMEITHVVRGCEYLTSTPKYNLLYDAFGWDIPVYVHLPLIMGKNEDGTVSKLSKRHGATGFEDLIKEGYLSDAIVNYIALLGWCPKCNNEFFTLKELEEAFTIEGISKSPAVFDYDKLQWFNGEYIRKMSVEEFTEVATPYYKKVFKDKEIDFVKISSILQQRVTQLTQIPEMIDFFYELPEYDVELYVNKRNKVSLENTPLILKNLYTKLDEIETWNFDSIREVLLSLAKEMDVKNGTIMWPARIAAAGKSVTPGGSVDILDILGKEESLNRIEKALEKLD